MSEKVPDVLQTTKDMRVFLLTIMRKLDTGNFDVKRAREIFNGSGRIVELANLDLEYMKVSRDLKTIERSGVQLSEGK